jgi:hypothetical protein
LCDRILVARGSYQWKRIVSCSLFAITLVTLLAMLLRHVKFFRPENASMNPSTYCAGYHLSTGSTAELRQINSQVGAQDVQAIGQRNADAS